MRLISDTIAKMDFMMVAIDDKDTKETLTSLLKKYQIQRRKILNLKNAWERVFVEDSPRKNVRRCNITKVKALEDKI
jgi:hypothetical protein